MSEIEFKNNIEKLHNNWEHEGNYVWCTKNRESLSILRTPFIFQNVYEEVKKLDEEFKDQSIFNYICKIWKK